MTTNRTISFSVALTEGEHQLLVALAAYEERRPGDALRVALREAARRRGLLLAEGVAPPSGRHGGHGAFVEPANATEPVDDSNTDGLVNWTR